MRSHAFFPDFVSGEWWRVGSVGLLLGGLGAVVVRWNKEIVVDIIFRERAKPGEVYD